MTRITLLASAVCLLLLNSIHAKEPGGFLLKENEKTVFLGDSVTAAGDYIANIDAYLMTRWPEKNFPLINLGLSSETASGLSEPKHPWPRPCVHERLDRVLEKIKPGLVFVCYGINDAIYHPFSEDRLAAYQDGILRLVAKVKASGARIVLITPVPFDAGSVPAKNLMPDGADDYNWMTPYRDYDKVMDKYAAWIMSQKDKVDGVIDMHSAVKAGIAAVRKTDPGYKSGDGVHPNALGHNAIARAVLAGLGVSAPDQKLGIGINNLPNPTDARHKKIFQLILQRHRLLSKSYLEHVGHKRPGKRGKVVPIEEAMKTAGEIEKQVRELAKAK